MGSAELSNANQMVRLKLRNAEEPSVSFQFKTKESSRWGVEVIAQRKPEEDEDDLACADTQIDVICPHGLRLARLRHSSGAEACVNLQNARVHSWCLADGAFAAIGSIRLMESDLPKAA